MALCHPRGLTENIDLFGDSRSLYLYIPRAVSEIQRLIGRKMAKNRRIFITPVFESAVRNDPVRMSVICGEKSEMMGWNDEKFRRYV